jgi:short subunit dehydrogenase-like uncharacterized protein
VPSTGFDCLPFDLGAYLAAQQLKQQGAKEVQSVTVAIRMDGGVSVSFSPFPSLAAPLGAGGSAQKEQDGLNV